MEKYYFIGKRNAVTAEIVKILQEKGIGFEFVEQGQYGIYDVTQKQVNAIIAQDKQPYLVGISSVRKGAILIPNYRVNCERSALRVVANDCGVALNKWQALVLANDEDVYNKYPYDVNQMAELIRMGYSSKDIEEVRAYNRAESGITPEEEKAAQLCLDRSRFKSELLVVKNLPHERFEAIIDRAFWMQRVQNVVIFTELGSVLYAGFADIAQGAFDRFHGSLSYCFWEGSWKTEEEQERIIQFLFEKTKEKDLDDLFY